MHPDSKPSGTESNTAPAIKDIFILTSVQSKHLSRLLLVTSLDLASN